MQYQIYLRNGDETRIIFDTQSPAQELALIDPTLHVEADAAGNFQTTVPPSNVALKTKHNSGDPMIDRLITRAYIKRSAQGSEIIWGGRLLTVDYDFKNQPLLYFEGAYSFLNDTMQEPRNFATGSTPDEVLTDILAVHNEKMDKYYGTSDNPMHFHTGKVRVYAAATSTLPATKKTPADFDSSLFFTKYEKTLESINRLRSTYGGTFRVRFIYSNGVEVPYLDWFEDYDHESDSTAPSAEFAVNLLDLKKKIDSASFYNCVNPIGAVVNKADTDALADRICVTSYSGTYSLLTQEPSDWASTFYNYYEKRRNVYHKIPHTYLAPEWKANTYYSATLTGGLQMGSSGANCSWGWGIRMYTNPRTKTQDYQNFENYSATGYWDSSFAWESYHENYPDHSIRVFPGENYYVQASGNGDTSDNSSTTLLTITENYLGRYYTYEIGDPAYTVHSSVAASTSTSSRTELNYRKVTIPQSKYGQNMYLNVCARIKDYSASPPTNLDDLMIDIWETRRIEKNLDENITLRGLGIGRYPSYISQDEDKKNILVTPTVIPDGPFIYPYVEAEGTQSSIVYYGTFSTFPSGGVSGKQYYCDTETGKVYTYTNDYKEDENHKTYMKEGYSVYDIGSVAKYGRIEKVTSYSDVTSTESLKALAAFELWASEIEEVNIDISAFDKAIIDNESPSPDVLDPVRLYSEPHGVSLLLPVQSRDINFNDLSSQEFSIGYKQTRKMTRFNARTMITN